MSQMSRIPLLHRYFLLTLDPVHIGTGGTRLGRVDNSIVREPGTRLPKIPGTSLHGVIRSYAAHRYGKPQCAGPGQQEGRKHCGQPTCPICYTFGYARDQGGGHAGVVSIGDARLLLFPVYSMVGPVWVTSPSALEDAGFRPNGDAKQRFDVAEGKAKWDASLFSKDTLNLGWLMVERDGDFPAVSWPEGIPEQIRKRVVLVSDKLFSQIVNSNLEVRTSVAINPDTGAAEEGALFTYEAIPRATVLWMDVVVNDCRDKFPTKKQWQEICQNVEETLPERLPESETAAENALRQLGYIGKRPSRGKDESEDQFQKRQRDYWRQVKPAHQACKHALQTLTWKKPLDIVSLGLEWAEHLGVGGMGTRGFGRIRNLHCQQVTPTSVVKCNGEENAHGDTENTEDAER